MSVELAPALLECNVFGRSGIRDGLHIAQRLLRIGDHGLCILRDGAPGEEREADLD